MIRAPASLTAAMIRRSPRRPRQSPAGHGPQTAAAGSGRLREDLRFFLVAWAAGFIAFLVFIA